MKKWVENKWRYWNKKVSRPDRRKPNYRLQRKFKMQTLMEELDSQKTKYYKTLDELELYGE
jgi:hypothetical protein